MKMITDLLLTTLLAGATAIIGYTNYYETVAKTSITAPNSVESKGKLLTNYAGLKNRLDATSNIRKAQTNADIRAREQRYRFFSWGQPRSDRDLQSEVRSKLEINLPSASLAVQSHRGVLTVAGMVETNSQLEQIATLAREINGVSEVEVRATVVPQ